MYKKFTKEELHRALHSKEKEADDILNNPSKWESFKNKFTDFLKKAQNIPALGKVIDDITTMMELVKAYRNKEYTDVPRSVIISIAGALLYTLSPFDVVPDYLPAIGYLDDVAVVTIVLGLGAKAELTKFRAWQDTNRIKMLENFKNIFVSEIVDLIGKKYVVGMIWCESNYIKFLLSEEQSITLPVECTIEMVNYPSEMLSEYKIVERDEVESFFDEVSKHEFLRWANGIEKKAYTENDFEDKWDNYIIMEA